MDAAIVGLCDELRRHSPLALAMAKRVLDHAYDGPLHLGLEVEARLRAAPAVADFREGVQAFVDKRPPEFTGE